MSTNAYPEPVVVANALSRLSDAVDRALAWLPYPGLISPDYREFSLRPDSRSDLAVTVPVMVAPGVLVQLVAPFPATSSDEFHMVKKLRDRFFALLEKLDATLALRSDYEQAARAIFEPEAHGRLVAVRLAQSTSRPMITQAFRGAGRGRSERDAVPVSRKSGSSATSVI